MDIKALVIDFSRVLVFANADVPSLNRHHDSLQAQNPGYRVLEHFRVNHELLSYLHEFAKFYPVYLFTDGRLHKLPEIAPDLKDIFKQVVEAEKLGYKKYQPEAFLALAFKIGYPPSDLLFVDDQPRNIQAAAEAGLATHRYIGNEDLIHLLVKATT